MNRAMTQEGLKQETVIHRGAVPRVDAFNDSVVAGFVRGGRFYCREDAGCPASGEMSQACA